MNPTVVPNYRETAPTPDVERALRDAPPLTLTAHAIGELVGHPTRSVVGTLNGMAVAGRAGRYVGGTDATADGEWKSLPAVWGLT